MPQLALPLTPIRSGLDSYTLNLFTKATDGTCGQLGRERGDYESNETNVL